MYDVFGLPLHPLVVHAVVVLLPLGALGMIACVLIAPLRRRYAGLALLVLLAGAASTLVAAASGQVLAEQVGTPATHMAWGELLPRVAIPTGGFRGWSQHVLGRRVVGRGLRRGLPSGVVCGVGR